MFFPRRRWFVGKSSRLFKVRKWDVLKLAFKDYHRREIQKKGRHCQPIEEPKGTDKFIVPQNEKREERTSNTLSMYDSWALAVNSPASHMATCDGIRKDTVNNRARVT
jgi:hypothetical protein